MVVSCDHVKFYPSDIRCHQCCRQRQVRRKHQPSSIQLAFDYTPSNFACTLRHWLMLQLCNPMRQRSASCSRSVYFMHTCEAHGNFGLDGNETRLPSSHVVRWRWLVGVFNYTAGQVSKAQSSWRTALFLFQNLELASRSSWKAE